MHVEYVIIRPPTMPDLTQGYFNEETTYELRLMSANKKMTDCLSITT